MMTLVELLRGFHWRLRSNRRDAAHMLGMVAGGLRNAARIRRIQRAGAGRSAGRRPTVAIMAMERMGDIVAAEPIARLARRRFPAARIFWITLSPYVALPETYPDVDHVVAVRCLTEAMLLQRLRLFDAAWNLHYNGYCCPQCCIPRDDPGLPHLLDYYEYGNLLEVQHLCAGLPRRNDGPVLVPPPQAAAAVDALALPPGCIVIHGESIDPLRQWAADKWRALAGRILAAHPAATIVEVGMQPQVVRQDGARQRALCGRLSVLETAEVIRRASLYIGIDSGPAHLAHAVGTPGVILLGHFANFRSYMPFSGGYADGTGATVLRAEGPAADLAVDEVLAAVLGRLAALGGAAAG